MIGRLVWSNGDRGLNERLSRIKAPTLLLWGEYDGIVLPAYAEAFKRMMTGTPSVEIHKIAAAGHVQSPSANLIPGRILPWSVVMMIETANEHSSLLILRN
jgi:hypothetical protein